ncbi:hypothetical protein [Mesorhizobium sp. LjRoot246]|uniref:hypothetical protein n=1 Tax=Mesorhizobium sp. LjRoot246 TaxID=3342294 RepID=UPI003ECE6944
MYPPRLRIRLEIETVFYSLCLALQMGANPQRLADQPLFRRRFGLQGSTRRRIALWEAQLRSNDADAWHGAAQDMKDYLEEQAGRVGDRRPLGRPVLIPDGFIRKTSAKIAVIGALLGVLAPTAPLVSVATALEALILFLAAFSVLLMVRMVGDKVHDFRSKARFRTIVITDQPELSSLGLFATWELYARIGHAVVLFVRSSLEDEVQEPPVRGLYTALSTPEGLVDALAAFATHADLIVLDTADEGLAVQVRALTRFPADRYRALSKDGSCPRDYRWVDPRTLVIEPADRRATRTGFDPYVRSTRKGGSWMADLYVFIAVASALLFARLPHGTPLVLFFIAAAILRILPEWLGPHRIRAISRATLRAPANPTTSRDLRPRSLARTLWIVTIGVACGAIAYFVARTGLHPKMEPDLTITMVNIAAWLALFGGNAIVAGVLILRKWSLDWNFRIIVLRRNSRVFGYGHKAFVMATCGKYGQVTSLHDYELDRTDEDFGEQRESSLGSWFPIFSEIEQTLKPDAFFHVWQRQVSIEMEVADFAVFDWVDDVTDNMRWELAEALKHLPAQRILVVAKPNNESGVHLFLDTCLKPSQDRPLLLVAGRDRDDKYIWSSHREFDAAFSAALYDALAVLTPQPRPRIGAPISGAWAYPCAADQQELA